MSDPSGSGKTTLLQLLGGLDRPDAGSVEVADRTSTHCRNARVANWRNHQLGFVYQFHHLLPEFSALENVADAVAGTANAGRGSAAPGARPCSSAWASARDSRNRPHQLSGGERQRAAVARALVTSPALVLADEPTGNLDGANAEQVFELMLELNRERGTSLIVVTHDEQLAARMGRVLVLAKGGCCRNRLSGRT